MKVKCRDYEGHLESINLLRKTIQGTRLYRVILEDDNEDLIDLKNVNLSEIEFIKE